MNPGSLKTTRAAERPVHAPNAALLIDFDNVTLGIRSDLTKELRTLLNSEIIRGKVAVQRAYADWRRYPQYIVPLSESSIDLIFAPAFGTAKKNATDIRLAIDAIELVFTRPEIGTVILLSGVSQPFLLLVISSSIAGVQMFIYSGLLIQLNRKALPKELQIGGVRLAVLAVSFLFFGILSVLLVLDSLGVSIG